MRMPSRDIASRLGIGYIEASTFDGKPKTLYPGFLAALASRAVTNFCQSADIEIDQRHVPWQKGLSPEANLLLKASLVAPAKAMWADLQGLNGWVPYKHEHYLKTWQLSDPRIEADYVLFDESQDANPVIAAIVAAQAEHGVQLVYVGDSCQEIYAWTGAVNALAKVKVTNRSYLTQSFRFGQAIADKANEVLALLNAEIRLTGNPAIDSRLEYLDLPKAILVRTNATGLTYLLKFQEMGRSAHFVGGAGELLSFARAAQELKDTGHTSHPDLVCFDSWAAVQDYVAHDESGEDLRLLVRLMDAFGSAAIITSLEHMPNENVAEVVISTAHKAKGREWESVQLANDFPQKADSQPADLRLLYVAETRAKEVLDSHALMEDSPSALLVALNEEVH
jgi:superfamily I DNA/RNA helicase